MKLRRSVAVAAVLSLVAAFVVVIANSGESTTVATGGTIIVEN